MIDVPKIKHAAEEYLALEEDKEFKGEIETLLANENWEELSDRFRKDLDFGTGGLRGVVGGGKNRINPYVIRRATQGLAGYIMGNVPEFERSVVIAHDSRHYSDLFAMEAARVMAANGIWCYLFSSLRPTPVLSFAVRQMGACAGVVITASHNPSKYNGYKVYWADGAQIVPPHDKGIIEEVRQVQGPVDAMDAAEAEDRGCITVIDDKIDGFYREMVVNQSLNSDLIKKHASGFKVVYTPLHGAGKVPVENVFGDLGIPLVTVPEQREPDGNFPTVEYPNPEEAPALSMAIELAKKEKADLVMATDPDADRLGAAIPDGDEWILITGNQLGALLADYIFRTLKNQNRLPENPAFINTIVTSELQNRIAESYGAACFRVLTGFKYIGEKIRQFENERTHNYVFGGEESYGYLVGRSVRDKDAVSAAAMTAELAIWNRSRGKTLKDHLEELWSQFGYWQELLISRNFEGQTGEILMDSLMESFRNDPPETISGIDVVCVRDYRDGTTKSMEDGTLKNDLNLPSSNVLQFVLKDGSMITARPSGTEPKIKFYASCCVENAQDVSEARKIVLKIFQNIEDWINGRMEAVQNNAG